MQGGGPAPSRPFDTLLEIVIAAPRHLARCWLWFTIGGQKIARQGAREQGYEGGGTRAASE